MFSKAWTLAEHLGIPVQWQQDWEGYIVALTESHVRIKDGDDKLIWAPTEHGTYSPKVGYPIIHDAHKPLVLLDWWGRLWKLKVPPHIKLFMWNVL